MSCLLASQIPVEKANLQGPIYRSHLCLICLLDPYTEMIQNYFQYQLLYNMQNNIY